MFCVPKVSSRTVGVVSCVRMMRLDGRSLIGVGVCIPRVAPMLRLFFLHVFSVSERTPLRAAWWHQFPMGSLSFMEKLADSLAQHARLRNMWYISILEQSLDTNYNRPFEALGEEDSILIKPMSLWIR